MLAEAGLIPLREAAAKYEHARKILPQLRRSQSELEAEVRRLRDLRDDEAEDVRALENGGFSAFLYGLIGKKEEKLTRERAQAAAAAAKYLSARRELEALEDEITALEQELEALSGAPERYADALERRIARIKSEQLPGAEELKRLENRRRELDLKQREIDEAVDAGERARMKTEEILDILASAEDWGTLDLFGGGLLSGVAKHGYIDDAQSLVPELQALLRRFEAELEDVHINAELNISAGGFLRFADMFFDGLFADLAALDHISEVEQNVTQTAEEIALALARLHGLAGEIERERREIAEKIERLAAGE